VRGCFRHCSARGIITDVVISGAANVGWSRSGLAANVGWSRSGLVSFLSSSLSLSRVGSSRSDAICGSDDSISTDDLVTGTKLFPSFSDAVTDDWKHCRGPSDEVRCSGLKALLQWNIEGAPVEG
jgi:hypothetical protein